MPLVINGQTRLVGVMGWPVEHSLSPQMHNAAFAALGMNCAYVPLAVHPDRLREAVSGLWAINAVGSNVTVPHKQAMQQFMHEISEEARVVGAVNTLVRRETGWHGYNSDIPGFLATLTESGLDPHGKRVLVLGAGGAARGIVYRLLKSGAAVTMMNRTVSRAEALAGELSRLFPGARLETRPLLPEMLKAEADQAHLLVNTTTVGMWPEADRCLWPDELPYPPNLTFFDLIYNPLRTRLMERAEAAGAQTINGLRMLVNQGAISFEWWFGVRPPTEIMYQTCWEILSKKR